MVVSMLFYIMILGPLYMYRREKERKRERERERDIYIYICICSPPRSIWEDVSSPEFSNRILVLEVALLHVNSF